MKYQKIEITKCSKPTFWYAEQIGAQLLVNDRIIGTDHVTLVGDETLAVQLGDFKIIAFENKLSDKEKAVLSAKHHKHFNDRERDLKILKENGIDPKDFTHDPVNRPAHYTSGKIEVIDFIEDQKLSFHLGNAVKYIARAGKKDPAKFAEDLRKSIWYINRVIEAQPETKTVQCAAGTPGCNGFMTAKRELYQSQHKVVCSECDKSPVNDIK